MAKTIRIIPYQFRHDDWTCGKWKVMHFRYHGGRLGHRSVGKALCWRDMVNTFMKRLTRKIERQMNKRELFNQIKDL